MDEEFGDDFEPTVVEDDEEITTVNKEDVQNQSQQQEHQVPPSEDHQNVHPAQLTAASTIPPPTTESKKDPSKVGFFYDGTSCAPTDDSSPMLFMNSPFGMIQAFLKKSKCKDMDEVRLRREQRVRASMATWRAWRDAVPPIRDIKAHVLSKASHTKLWWQGIPTNLRSYFWIRALDNTLNVTGELYSIMLLQSKSKNIFAAEQKNILLSAISSNREQASSLIRSDVPRTFALLQFFKPGGPYHDSLRDVLEAYVCYRPDLGYVQGMTYLAATALLNLGSAGDAFVFVANMLNSPVQRGFYAMDAAVIGRYSRATTLCLRTAAPRLAKKLEDMGIAPEMYIVEWVMTVFSKVLPLDVAVHVWDMWLLEGDYFIFRTIVGLLAMYEDFLMFLRFEDIMRFLRCLPQDIIDEALFESIAAVPLNAKKFQMILDKC